MRDFSKVKRMVLKIGSSSLIHSDFTLNQERIYILMKAIHQLRNRGIDVALVTSGAIALGMSKLNLSKRPKAMSLKQACASVGQAGLMDAYNRSAAEFGMICGQILLSHDDFEIRKRMICLSDTLDAMFKNNIIPIINENDALTVEEIKVGDNDTLAALLVPMIKAELLILFSDIDGLYNKNPKVYKDAEKIDCIEQVNREVLAMAGVSSSDVGTGGMITKLNAAIISTHTGCDMLICNSEDMIHLERIIEGETIGTLFLSKPKGISSREHWMIFKAYAHGEILIDDGLKNMLQNRKVSILPKGILKVEGHFFKGDVIDIKDENHQTIAKGISNYSSVEIDKMKGLETTKIKENSSDFIKEEIVHANNLVMIGEDMLC